MKPFWLYVLTGFGCLSYALLVLLALVGALFLFAAGEGYLKVIDKPVTAEGEPEAQ